MANRRGRPPIADQAALRRVAEHILDNEAQGVRCSIRAAILRTSDRVTGNSSDAMLWRLQRKWRRYGPALLAVARERRARERHVARVPTLGGFAGSFEDEIKRVAGLHDEFNQMIQLQDELRRMTRYQDDLKYVAQLQDEFRRIALDRNEVTRSMDEIKRIAQLQDEMWRVVRGW